MGSRRPVLYAPYEIDDGDQTPELGVGIATVDLSAAQIVARQPVAILPAPGVGKAFVMTGGLVSYRAGTVAFGTDGAVSIVNTDGIVAESPQLGFDSLNDRVAQILPNGQPFARGDAENRPLFAIIDTTAAGGVATAEVTDAGAAYQALDAFTLDGGDGQAAGVVDTVDGGGAILTFHLTAPGSGYVVGTPLDVVGGNGNSATITPLTLSDTSDGTVRASISYFIATLS